MTDHLISENLNLLIKQHDGISILELSKRTQIPQPTLHHILNGETKKPRKQALEALANFFKVTIDQITGLHPLPKIPHAMKETLKIATVPIIEWDMLKDVSTSSKISSANEIILEKQVSQNSFALVMKNPSMEPLFPENSLLIFDSGKKPKDRDFSIVLLDNKSILFNRIFIDGNEFYIKQDQQNGGLVKLNFPQDQIVATLIEVRLEF